MEAPVHRAAVQNRIRVVRSIGSQQMVRESPRRRPAAPTAKTPTNTGTQWKPIRYLTGQLAFA